MVTKSVSQPVCAWGGGAAKDCIKMGVDIVKVMSKGQELLYVSC